MKRWLILLAAALITVFGQSAEAQEGAIDGWVSPYDFPIPAHELPNFFRDGNESFNGCQIDDKDLDGDWLVEQDELFPQLGDFIGDKPKLSADLLGPLDAYIDYTVTGSTIIETKSETLQEAERQEVRLSSYSSEIRSHYAEKVSSDAGLSASLSIQDALKLDFGKAFEGKLSFEANANVEKSFSQTRSWKLERSAQNRLLDMSREIISKTERGEISFDARAGRISGYIRVMNTTPRNMTLVVEDMIINVYAYHPVTAYKEYVGVLSQRDPASLLPPVITLPRYGYLDISIPDISVSTNKMLNWLSQGYVFGAELAGVPGALLSDTAGTRVMDLITSVHSRTAVLAIKSEVAAHEYWDASIYNDGGGCKTIQQFLEDAIRTQTSPSLPDIEFDRDPSGQLYVMRVRSYLNRHHDDDFDSLSEADKTEYSKWVVGYFPSENNPFAQRGGQFELDNTIVAPGDKVYLYRLTRADFETPVDEVIVVDPLADDVGIVSGSTGCPNGTKKVRVWIDGEDDEPYNGDASGWRGLIDADPRNADVILCRVDGAKFHPTVWGGPDAGVPSSTPPVALDKYGYAVVKLGDHCPHGSSEYHYDEDTEDDHNATTIWGPASPGLTKWSSGSGLHWNICVFRYTIIETEERTATFPDLGTDYGVFAAPVFEGANGALVNNPKGWVLVDDEEDGNSNDVDYYGNTEVQEVGEKVFYETPGHNTMMKLVRVQ